MKRILAGLALLIEVSGSAAGGSPPESREGAPILLGEGEQVLIRFPLLRRFSLGSDCVRSLAGPSAREDTLLLKAVKPGQTDLWVWKKDGSTERRSIRVSASEKEGRPRNPALEKALSRLEEVEVILSGNGGQTAYLLRGEVHSLREARRIEAATRGFPESVINETEPSPALLESGESRVRSWLEKSPFREWLILERHSENRTLWLRGSLDTPGERDEAQRSARELYPFLHLDLNSLPDASPTIHFKVFLLEMKKQKLRSLGLQWSDLIPAALRVNRWGMSEAIQLEAALHAMEGEGSARILSRPELVVRAPGEAELFAGGELPIQTRTPYQSQVNWRQFGLLLKLKVLSVTRRKVRVDVMTEVSHLDPKISLRDIPGLQANRMKTQVDASFGSPLLLSGLLQEDMNEMAQGIPGLSRIPILGNLFRSKDYQTRRSELVAILLPANEPPNAPAFPSLGLGGRKKHSPAGPVPPPRNWLSAEEEKRLRESPDFPWNAFAAGPQGGLLR